jgi:hypothetical protein
MEVPVLNEATEFVVAGYGVGIEHKSPGADLSGE